MADIARMGQPHDPTNSDGVNQDGENEQPWTPSSLLDLGQNDQDGQVTLVSCNFGMHTGTLLSSMNSGIHSHRLYL